MPEKGGADSQHFDQLGRSAINDAAEHGHHGSGKAGEKGRFRSSGVTQSKVWKHVAAEEAEARQRCRRGCSIQDCRLATLSGSRFRKISAKTKAAVPNRMVRKSSVEASASARFTITKVAPQIRVMTTRLPSTSQPAGRRVPVVITDLSCGQVAEQQKQRQKNTFQTQARGPRDETTPAGCGRRRHARPRRWR